MVTVDLISIFIIRFTDIFHDHSRNIITIQSAFSSFLSLSLSLSYYYYYYEMLKK